MNFDEQPGQKSWEEDHYHMDKMNGQQHNQTHLEIHASDALGPTVLNDGAPSRPPSRVSPRVFTTTDGELVHCCSASLES